MRLASPKSLVAVLAFSLAAGPLFAQSKPKPPATTGKTPAAPEKAPAATEKVGRSAISGVVLDSLNGRYLRGADVIIQGAKVSLVTDSLGKFRIDSLAPGTYLMPENLNETSLTLPCESAGTIRRGVTAPPESSSTAI